MKRPILTAIIVILILAACPATYCAVAKVTLRAESEVRPAQPVTIRDVAGIEGSKDLAARIGGITLISGPLAGERKTIDASYIKVRIAAANLPQGIAVKGPEKIALLGKCVRVSSQQLGEEARSFILSQLPQDNRTYEATIERNPREVIISGSDIPKIRPRLLSSTVRFGTNAVALDVVADGKIVGTASAALYVKAVADVLVTTDSIRQGEAISALNAAWEQRDITRITNAIVTRGSGEIPELIARRTLSSGTIITSNDASQPLTVHKGDSINLIVRSGNVTLRTTAEAMQDGRTGDTIRVRSSVSNEDIRAKIIEPGLVEITR